MTIFYSFSKYGGIRMYNPFPFDTERTRSMLYWGYSLEECKKRFRLYMGLEKKHIKWVEL